MASETLGTEFYVNLILIKLAASGYPLGKHKSKALSFKLTFKKKKRLNFLHVESETETQTYLRRISIPRGRTRLLLM